MKAAWIFLAAAALTVSCTQKQNTSNAGEPTADIFSNRQIGVVPELFVVTLQEPALLAAAKATPAGLEIPADAKQAVLNEQAQFEQKLKSVAPQAQVIYRYRLTLNAIAVYAPGDVTAAIHAIAGIRSVAPVRQMARPQAEVTAQTTVLTSSTNSVNFIGADKAHSLGFTGKGMRVGVLDTGIDYTHKMLGGSGNKADYTAINPDQPNAAFPNAKVAGGLDLVGTEFNAASPFPNLRLPKPDANPIDEAGHGTHVAGTIAGIGDGKATYSGVAPEATVYGIKVFGKDGSTSDAVVIAGFEYAADPDLDLDPKDRLDVVNLSLGGGFGQPQILYSEAVKNITRAGTVVVASAGNSGPEDYIVGAPSTSDDAISVAASVDGSLHNWQFGAVRFTNSAGGSFLSKAVEGSISKPVDEVTSAEGPLVFIGLADKDLTEEEKLKLSGKVALIMRGKVPFAEKLKRAHGAGAIGAVVINSEPGDRTMAMGGDGKFDIPAIMIGNETGQRVQKDMTHGEVRVQFKTPDRIFEPELIDTITDFSSKGPRSEDNLFKPEISAPGASIISAAMGEGAGGTQMSGTSMAAPHMAGVMALMREAHPSLSALELKSLVMDTSKVLRGQIEDVPMTLQGAGRVQVDKAITAAVIVSPHALSLGRVQVGRSRRATNTITVKNISNAEVTLSLVTKTANGLRLTVPSNLTVAAGATATVVVESEVSMPAGNKFSAELDGRIFFMNGAQVAAHLPALAIATQASLIQGSTPGADKLTLTNASPLDGVALAFNLLGEDARKATSAPHDQWKNRSCDLQSAGYRIVTKPNGQGAPTEYLQIGFKLHTPLTTWIQCDVSALIDADGDGVAEQELAGANGSSLDGSGVDGFASILLDAKKAREIRLAYEKEIADGKEDPKANFKPAILSSADMLPFPHSTVAVIEAPLALIAKAADGQIHVKLAAQNGMGTDAIEADDYLGRWNLGEWKALPAAAAGQAYSGLPAVVELKGLGQQALTYTRGSGAEKLVLYYPNNELRLNGHENQSQIY
jgi:subtilisin family serine protease